MLSPKGNDVRPTTDKVKEAVFSMLIPYIDENCIVMDVFAGSGNMGLEALSRGAKTVFFSDDSRYSISLVKENVRICGVEERAILLSGDFRNNIKRVHEKVRVFILDPPYADGHILPALDAIQEAGNIEKGGIVVCEHAYRDLLPEEYGNFKRIKDKKYGSIGVTFYEYD